ncbi:MAG: MmcQ/YjbR family DNA-binding protein [Alphaproteobacteria bacterium]
MTPAAFLKLALSLPEAVESSHFDQRDIRVRGKIFASPGERANDAAVLKFTPEQQQMLCEAEPEIFVAVPGGWGAKGWTQLFVPKADAATARSALWTAWRNVAPKALQKLHPATPA